MNNKFYKNIINFNYSLYDKNKYLCTYYEIIYILNLLNKNNFIENIQNELKEISMKDLYIYNGYLKKKYTILTIELENIINDVNNLRKELLKSYDEKKENLDINLNFLTKKKLDLEIKIKLITNKSQIIDNYVEIKNFNINVHENVFSQEEINKLIMYDNVNDNDNDNDKIILMNNYLSQLLTKNEIFIMNDYLSDLKKNNNKLNNIDENYYTNNNKNIFLLDELNNDNISLYRILSKDIVVFDNENFDFLFEDIKYMENNLKNLKYDDMIELLKQEKNENYKNIIDLYRSYEIKIINKNLLFENKFYDKIKELNNNLGKISIINLNLNVYIKIIDKLFYHIYNMSKNNVKINRIVYYFIFYYLDIRKEGFKENDAPNYDFISKEMKKNYDENKIHEYFFYIINLWKVEKEFSRIVMRFMNFCDLRLYTEEIVKYNLSIEPSISNYGLNNYYIKIKSYFGSKSIRELDIHIKYLSNLIKEIKVYLTTLKNEITKMKNSFYNKNNYILNDYDKYLDLKKLYMKKKTEKNNINDILNFINLHIKNLNENINIDVNNFVDYIYITDCIYIIDDDNLEINLYDKNYYSNNKNKIFKKSNFNKNKIDEFYNNVNKRNEIITDFYTDEIKLYFNQINDFKFISKNINDTYLVLTNNKTYKYKKALIYKYIIVLEQNKRIEEENYYSQIDVYNNYLNINTILY